MNPHEPPITAKEVRAVKHPFLQRNPHLEEAFADIINLAAEHVDTQAKAKDINAEAVDAKIRAQIQASAPEMKEADVARQVASVRGRLPQDFIKNPALMTPVVIAQYIDKALTQTDAEKTATLKAKAATENVHGAGSAAKALKDLGALAHLRGGGGGEGREGGRKNFADLRIASGDYREIQNITPKNFAGSPFEQAGMNYAVLDYLRKQDSSFTSQNILNAAGYAGDLGFSKTDRGTMKDLTTIDRYDPNAKKFIDDQKALKDALMKDEQWRKLKEQYDNAKTDDERKQLQAEMAARAKAMNHPAYKRIVAGNNDPTLNPKARKARTNVTNKVITGQAADHAGAGVNNEATRNSINQTTEGIARGEARTGNTNTADTMRKAGATEEQIERQKKLEQNTHEQAQRRQSDTVQRDAAVFEKVNAEGKLAARQETLAERVARLQAEAKAKENNQEPTRPSPTQTASHKMAGPSARA